MVNKMILSNYMPIDNYIEKTIKSNVISGYDFNMITKGIKYVKISKDEHDFKEGLNICENTLYEYNKDVICYNIKYLITGHEFPYYFNIWDVTIPDNARVLISDDLKYIYSDLTILSNMKKMNDYFIPKMSGELFNKLYGNNNNYVKLTTKSYMDNVYEFKEGLNEYDNINILHIKDIKIYNKEYYIFNAVVPNDAEVLISDKKISTNKIILSNVKPIDQISSKIISGIEFNNNYTNNKKYITFALKENCIFNECLNINKNIIGSCFDDNMKPEEILMNEFHFFEESQLHIPDCIYKMEYMFDVIIPDDAHIIVCYDGDNISKFKSNKFILCNKRVNDKRTIFTGIDFNELHINDKYVDIYMDCERWYGKYGYEDRGTDLYGKKYFKNKHIGKNACIFVNQNNVIEILKNNKIDYSFVGNTYESLKKYYIHDVVVPNDAEVTKFDNKIMVNQFVLHNKRPLHEFIEDQINLIIRYTFEKYKININTEQIKELEQILNELRNSSNYFKNYENHLCEIFIIQLIKINKKFLDVLISNDKNFSNIKYFDHEINLVVSKYLADTYLDAINYIPKYCIQSDSDEKFLGLFHDETARHPDTIIRNSFACDIVKQCTISNPELVFSDNKITNVVKYILHFNPNFLSKIDEKYRSYNLCCIAYQYDRTINKSIYNYIPNYLKPLFYLDHRFATHGF
jgi:hypothetical protein